MKQTAESLFILLTKSKRNTIYLRQQANGLYYFSKKKLANPSGWLLKNIYIEDESVTMEFVNVQNFEKRTLTVISHESFEKIFYFIEPSKFAPFPHAPQNIDTTIIINEIEQNQRIKQQTRNIWLLAGAIIFLILIFARFATI
ncbi:hypothetical protein M2139_002102 [Enterococcus sp. PF1-24]|uniref:hypothetical protein n=1 Tax=unclassified Enterococcus TaxID=2608891 RepID=UPI00247352D9|nr:MULTISPECIES: hypothetical protein [unclassified Enterococcus]MDH6365101.1 hypothetical protein [Enterococcus sp. PFB1-1]MDH6402202.1 hypothetical protein [Enterococcus sp. PF1-24]